MLRTLINSSSLLHTSSYSLPSLSVTKLRGSARERSQRREILTSKTKPISYLTHVYTSPTAFNLATKDTYLLSVRESYYRKLLANRVKVLLGAREFSYVATRLARLRAPLSLTVRGRPQHSTDRSLEHSPSPAKLRSTLYNLYISISIS